MRLKRFWPELIDIYECELDVKIVLYVICISIKPRRNWDAACLLDVFHMIIFITIAKQIHHDNSFY